MSNINIPSLECFDCDGDVSSVGLRWQKWKRALQIYLEAAGIENSNKKKAVLLHFGGIALQEVFYNLPGANVTDGDNGYEIALQKLDQYFAPKQSKVYERHLFRLLKQEQGEKFEKFLVRLRHQAAKCQFPNLDKQIIDQITEKGLSIDLRKKILAMGDAVNLDMIIAEANSLETIERQMSEFNEKPSTSSSCINVVETGNSKRNLTTKKFFRCGLELNKQHNCPANDVTCNICHRVGHYARCCFKKRSINFTGRNDNHRSVPNKKFRSSKIATRANVNCVEAEEEHVFHIDNDDDKIECKVGGISISMLIDSGSRCNIICEKTWESLKKSKVRAYNQVKNPSKILFAYGSKDPLQILGCFDSDIKIANNRESATFYVIKNGKKNLLGKDTAIALKVLRIGLGLNNVDVSAFPKMKNVIVNIPIDKTVTPVSQPYRRVPIPLESKINKKLEELLSLDIIEEVKGPSEWVSPMVPVLKENGDVRICIDKRRANTAILRENHPLPTMNSLLPHLRKAKYFSMLDIKNAFYQIEISPESRYITTFISSKGLYRYKRLLFGINAAPGIFQKTMEKLLLSCDGTLNFIDDILIFGKNEEEHDQRVQTTLNTLGENNVLLNKEKCIFKVKEIKFLGHTLTENGIRPLESYINSIKSFRRPSNIDELHSFLGLVNFIGKWIPNLATLTEPLRELLRLRLTKHASIEKYWGKTQNEYFSKLKEALSAIGTLGYYDPGDRTQVIADASPVGLGAVLIQIDREGPRIIAFGNKSLTDIEKRYCQTEKEALALVWAVEHFKIYLYGKEFELITDHKPLETIFGQRSRPCARIERWVLRLQSFKYKIVYQPGKSNIADPLSRLCQSNSHSTFIDHDYVHQIVEYARPVAVTLQEIQQASENDEEILKIRKGIQTNEWQDPIEYCRVFQEEFCFSKGILLRGSRIVIPIKLRQRVLDAAHEGHPGIVSMKSRLRTKVWWPKVDENAEKIIKSCKGCTLVSSQLAPHPMKRREIPTGPWIDVAVDFMGPLPSGDYIFVIIDYFSRYKEIKIMKKICSTNTISVMKDIFSRLGFPVSITADNGRQFISEEMKTFCNENGIKNFHTIPYWPQMNGEVERQNRAILKRLKISQALKNNWQQDLRDYLMMYNSTPHSVTGKTPCELFFRRQFRDKLPCAIYSESMVIDQETKERDLIEKEKGKEYGDRKRKANEDIDINVGEKVYQKNLIRTNRITPEFDPAPHTIVSKKGGDVVIRKDSSGQEYRRNIIHLKKVEGQWKVSKDDYTQSDQGDHQGGSRDDNHCCKLPTPS